jgi:cellulose synthase operon protein C
VGANYDVRADAGYQITPHWFAEGFVGGNNARNYNSASVGFAIHYLFRTQPSTVTAPTGLFPHDGLPGIGSVSHCALFILKKTHPRKWPSK